MFTDFWTSDLVFRRMVVQLRRMAFLNKIYSPRGVEFCPLSLKVVRDPPFYFISWVYIYWNTSVQTFTKIWVQDLFGWNDLNLIPAGGGSVRADFNFRKLPCYLSNTYEMLPLLLKFNIGEQNSWKNILSRVSLVAMATRFLTPCLVKFWLFKYFFF